MLISLCAPCHNRTYDLKIALPTWIEAANFSPPAEIIVLNYNSPDDLEEYMEKMQSVHLAEGNSLVHLKYTGRNYYHMAHARNLAVLSSSGEYFIGLSADSLMSKNSIKAIRKYIAEYNVTWMRIRKNFGIIICKRDEFIDAGGYDERFEFYGPEDKDLGARLMRRGHQPISISIKYIGYILTPNSEKAKNYRLKISKREMSKILKPIYLENREKNILVANEGKEWGQWI